MISNDAIRRNMAVFSMSVVSKLTDLTPRQIRYYETHELIKPERTEGPKRLFSLNDLERLLEIKSLLGKRDLISKGLNKSFMTHRAFNNR